MLITSKTKALLILGAACLTIAVIPAGLLSASRSAEGSTAPSSVVAPEREVQALTFDESAREPVATSTHLGFYSAPVGTVLSFHLKSHQSTTMSARGDQAAESTVSIDMDGIVRLHVLDRRDDEILASVSYSSAHLRLESNGQPASSATVDEIRHQLAEPAYVRLRPDGSVVAWVFSEASSPTTRQMERAFFSLTRFVAPIDAADAWSTRESDATGSYDVRYRRTEAGDSIIHVTRQRLQCVPTTDSTDLGGTTVIDDLSSGSFDKRIGWLASADCRETMTVEFADVDIRIVGTSSATLRLQSSAFETPAVARATEDWKWSDDVGLADRQREADVQQQRLERAAVEHLTLEQIFLDLAGTIDATGLDSEQTFHLRELLKMFLRQRADELARCTQLALDGSLRQNAIGVVLSAIGSVGTPPMQRALVEVLADPRHTDATRALSLVALFQVHDPKPDTWTAVHGQWLDGNAARQVRGTALLLLGAYALTSDERAAVLLQQRTLAEEAGMVPAYIGALGNAKLFAEIEPYLGNSDPGVHNAAEQALSWQ